VHVGVGGTGVAVGGDGVGVEVAVAVGVEMRGGEGVDRSAAASDSSAVWGMGSMSLRTKAATTPATKHKTGTRTQAFLDAWCIKCYPRRDQSRGIAPQATDHNPARAPQRRLTTQSS
jgi:hypothetical protein